jgi:monofunctional biosynthetic peptidoglycan transglycosylase
MKRAVVLAWKVYCYALGVITVCFLLLQGWYFAHILSWKLFDPGPTRFMELRLEELRAKDAKAQLKHAWVDYARINMNLKRAVIVAEDAKFADHEGFDWEGIQRALERNKRGGRVVAGGSTITQQLAKNLFLSGDRSYLRKGQEALITLMLEWVLDKQRILEMYLNVAEWGEGVFGAQAAAQHYYKTTADRLSAEQSARLAAMLPRPQFYDRNRGTPYLAEYSARILARMPGTQLP